MGCRRGGHVAWIIEAWGPGEAKELGRVEWEEAVEGDGGRQVEAGWQGRRWRETGRGRVAGKGRVAGVL